MYHAHVSGESVVAREALLLGADVAVYLLLAGVVDRILVSCKIVGSREDRVARLACGRVGAVAAVRSGLGVPRREALAGASSCSCSCSWGCCCYRCGGWGFAESSL